MYIKNGIAYAGESTPPIRVCGIRPLPGFRLWARFTTGEAKTIDFAPLRNPETFAGVYIDYGVPIWCDGEVDIAPERLYAIGTPERIA